MFLHRIQVRGHTFDLIFEGKILGRVDGSRGDLRGDHGSGSTSELTGGLLQIFSTRLTFVNSTIAENDHGSGSVSESQGGRILDFFLGGRESWTTKEKL